MVSSMTTVAATTIRATRSALPGYGVNSSLSHSRNHLWLGFERGSDCAIDAISTPSNHDNCRLAHPQQVRGRIFDTYANRITGRQMHPVQRPLHVWETLLEAADHVRIRGDTEPYAVHYT